MREHELICFQHSLWQSYKNETAKMLRYEATENENRNDTKLGMKHHYHEITISLTGLNSLGQPGS